MLSLAIQAAKPDLRPSDEPDARSRNESAGGPSSAGPSMASSSQTKSKVKGKGKGNQPQKGGGSKTGKKTRRAKKHRPDIHKPPKPLPPLAARLSVYSPALESGIIKETFKMGMDKGQLPGSEMFLGGGSGEDGPGGSGGAAGGMGGPGGGGMGPVGGSKGKRKVVRARG
jgi:signal recognition particle subunit SRP19